MPPAPDSAFARPSRPMPAPPAPYRATTRVFSSAPLHYARRVPLSDGALAATFVYGPAGTDLNALLAATPVLALHGNGGTHATFAQVIERLVAAGLGVVAMDARGQGQTERGTAGPLTYELMAQDAVDVLDCLGVARAHVLGHSDGGIEALLLARDYPQRVASIVAGGANLTPEGVVDEWDTARTAQLNREWAAWAAGGDVPANVDLDLLPSPHDASRDAELLQLMVDEPHIDAASLGAIRCPACVLVGEHDCIAPEQTKAIASAIPGVRLVVVPGMGHSLPRKAPDAVALQVLTNVLLSQTARA